MVPSILFKSAPYTVICFKAQNVKTDSCPPLKAALPLHGSQGGDWEVPHPGILYVAGGGKETDVEEMRPG